MIHTSFYKGYHQETGISNVNDNSHEPSTTEPFHFIWDHVVLRLKIVKETIMIRSFGNCIQFVLDKSIFIQKIYRKVWILQFDGVKAHKFGNLLNNEIFPAELTIKTYTTIQNFYKLCCTAFIKVLLCCHMI